MNDIRSKDQSPTHFDPRWLILNVLALHVIGVLLLAPFLVTALVCSLSYKLMVFGGLIVFIWAWRYRQRWLPALLFLGFSIAFWAVIMLPWIIQ